MSGEDSDLLEVRSNSIVEYSLSELAFVLFFILLLFITFKTVEFQREAEKTEKELAELQTNIDSMSTEMEALKEENDLFKERFPSTIDKEELDKMFTELVAAKGLVDRNDEITKALVEAADKITELEERLKNTSEQLSGVTQALNEERGEPSFCWYDAEGNEEPIFDVVVNDRGYSVYGHWPESRNSEVRNTPGVNPIIRNLQTRDEFLANALDLFRVSVAKECRYLVRYFDEISSSDGDGIRTASRAVQDRFYIFDVPGDEVYETWIKNQ